MFEHTMCSSNCKVHKSLRRDDNYMREPCYLFIEGTIFARDHSLGISPVSRGVWKSWGKTWTQFSCKLLLYSRVKLISFGRVQTFKKFGYTLIYNNNVIHERGRPTEKWDLTMITFVEHIRKLTIKFLSLFNF